MKTIKELSKEKIEKLIDRAIEFKNGKMVDLSGHSVATLFLESSTRTLISFQKAAKNLKMDVFNINIDKSSFNKGETLEDTLENLKAMGINNFVIRNSETEYWNNFKNKFNIANGGDGTKNHPSQALLDAMTIKEHFGTLANLKVAIIGDIKHSRVYHSNFDLLTKFDSKVDVLGPLEFGGSGKNISTQIDNYDVLMFLRIQHERHNKEFIISDYNDKFGFKNSMYKLLKSKSIIMHPGPINWNAELSSNISYKDPQIKILDQVTNGVFIRMAILEDLCKNM